MRVLIVEDVYEVALELAENLSSASPSIDVDIRGSRSSGIAAIECHEFDFIVCDLRLPPHDGELAMAEAHGLEVRSAAKTLCPGTPCLFFTGFGTSQSVWDQLSGGGTFDIFGTGDSYGMTQLLTKDKLLECVDRLKHFNAELAALGDIEVYLLGGSNVLDSYDKRALQWIARFHRGTSVEARGLGGQSGAQALRISVKDEQDRELASYFAKVGWREKMREERENYSQHVSSLLKMGHYPALVRDIQAGIGKREALFYQLADGYTKSLFDVLEVNQGAAIGAVEQLREIFAPWAGVNEMKLLRVSDLRSHRIKDSEFLPYRDVLEAVEDFERVEQEIKTGRQHGDLHGFNVLCNEPGTPVVIDFGNVGPAPTCIDPILLELSVVFHSDSPFRTNAWPTNEQAEAWFNLGQYLHGCPVPEFIKKCREWANETAGPNDLPKVVYVEAVRQLKYGDTNHDLALGIARAAIREGT